QGPRAVPLRRPRARRRPLPRVRPGHGAPPAARRRARERARRAPRRSRRAAAPAPGVAVRAMIVAAGLGTRLRPPPELLPRPAPPARGGPLAAYQPALPAPHGVREVVINTPPLAERLEDAARRHCPPGISLTFSRERELLDTGGGIRRVAAFLRESDPCLLVGGDMLLDVDLAELVRGHRERAGAVTLLLREDPRVAEFGSVGVDEAGVVRRIGSRFRFGGDEARAGLFAWAIAVSPRAFDSMPDREVFGLFDDW